MAIIAREQGGGGTFQPAPEGQFLAVCCDVVDLGIEHYEWQGQPKSAHKVRIVFQIAENMEDGRPFTVGQKFTLSLGENANLRKFLESWRGKKFTPEELRDGFDVERLIGAPALLQIVHAQKGDKTYANIQSVMKAMKGMPTLAVRDYTRVKDREPQQPAPAPQPAQPPQPAQRPQAVPALAPVPADDGPPVWDSADDLPFS